MDKSLNQDNKLGYIFIPFEKRDSIGFKELIINISENPTGDHFDPVEVHVFAAVNDHTAVEEHTFFHPYRSIGHHTIAPGIIIIQDRKGKREEAFSFGGTLSILTQTDLTQCHLVSTAPILPANHRHTVIRTLLDEIQIVMAERRAAWMNAGEEAFEKKLLEVDPLVLCAVFLSSILKEFSDVELQSLGPNRMLLDTIREEIRNLKENGKWPAEIPSIEEIL
ncbi:MAG: hypothetical protein JXA25_13035 [Anaerolineales bacterium]|nr:hypothetical protein [Anaerolineales bacterium]